MLSVASTASTSHSLSISTLNFNFKSCNPSSIVRCHATVVPPAPKRVSHYEVLGVRRNASPSDIKTAYRSLAKRYHPDTHSASPELDFGRRSFVEINDAYETLSDSDHRAVYDSSIGLLGIANATPFRGGYSSVTVGPAGHRNNPTRNWESDQCW